MSLSIFRCVALTALLSLTAVTASAQTCGTPSWGGNPGWNPAPAQYFLGVQVQTVNVGQSGWTGGGQGAGPISGPMMQGGVSTRIAPGYGQTVYGQRVAYVTPNSPAFHAGLEVGDIILDANGAPMDSSSDLRRAISNSRGYMQMKVIDVRTRQISWVVANVGQSTNPIGAPNPIGTPGPISGPMFSQPGQGVGGNPGSGPMVLGSQSFGSNGRQAPIARSR